MDLPLSSISTEKRESITINQTEKEEIIAQDQIERGELIGTGHFGEGIIYLNI